MKFKRITVLLRKTRWVLAAQLIGAVLSALCSGCASTGYVGNRMRDAGDIFTATVGLGGGAKVRVGPLSAGLCYYADSAGVRAGYAGAFSDRKIFRDADLKGDCTIVLASSDHFETEKTQSRNKTIDSRTPTFEVIPFILTLPAPFIEVQRDEPTAGPSFYTQLEVIAAVGGGVRLGFNPGELLDFLLGWTTIDIFNDDLKKESEHPPGRVR